MCLLELARLLLVTKLVMYEFLLVFIIRNQCPAKSNGNDEACAFVLGQARAITVHKFENAALVLL